MSLDDRSLREHLDRRANAGTLDPAAIADAVATRLPASSPSRWASPWGWPRPLVPLAAALAVVAVAGVALLPRFIGPGPASSPTSSLPAAAAYPSDRPLTREELIELVTRDDPALAGVVVVADVELEVGRVDCEAPACVSFFIPIDPVQGAIGVWAEDPEAASTSPYAFRLSEGPNLDLLGSVRSGPDALPWTLADLLDELPLVKGPGVLPVHRLYLVDGVKLSTLFSVSCVRDDPPFGCWDAPAWLVTDESAEGPTATSAPPASLRLPNLSERPQGRVTERGYWLVDPFVEVGDCMLCPPAGAADLLGRVATLQELGLDPPTAPTTSPSPASPTAEPTPAGPRPQVVDIEFSIDSLTIDGLDTADVEVTVTFDREVVEMGQMDMTLTPLVCLQRAGNDDATSSAVTQMADSLEPTGDLNTWRTTFRFVSSQHGTWWVSCLQAYDAHGVGMTDDMVGIDPYALDLSPTLEVIGTHRPNLTMEFSPQPVTIGDPLTVSGIVTDENGSPFPNLGVTIGQDNVCAEGGGGDVVTTDAEGRYAYVFEQADRWAICAWLVEVPGYWPIPWLESDPIGLYGSRFNHPDVTE